MTNLICVLQLIKPQLNYTYEKKREKFYEWAIQKLKKDAIFICNNELWYKIDNDIRHK